MGLSGGMRRLRAQALKKSEPIKKAKTNIPHIVVTHTNQRCGNKRNVRFEKVRRNVRRKGQGEYDIVAVDEGKVLVVEVKNKLEKRMVDEFIEQRLPRFKELFPEYARFRVEGGMGALVVREDVGRYAEKAGLYVLTQTDEGGATLLNSKDFEPREFA